MKKIVFLLIFISSLSSANAYSAVISANFGTITPITITNELDLIADFEVSGIYTDLNVQLNLSFDQNILDANDNLTISYKGPGLLFNIIDFTPDISLNSIAFNLSGLSVNNDGKAIISLAANSDGVNLDSIFLSGIATITPVPLPPSILLFLSGFLTILIKVKR
jgi:hypothetical protein